MNPFLPLGIPIPTSVEPPTTAWGLTPWGLILLTVLAIMRGWLVPGATVKRIEADRDEWKQTALKALDQNAQLMAQGRTVATLLEGSLPATPTNGDR